MCLGFLILARAKGTPTHRLLGRWFAYATLLVCASAIAGLIAFRFLPLFAVLSALVLYQLVGAWRAAKTRELGPRIIDAVWSLTAAACLAALAPIVIETYAGPPVILYSSLGALGFVVTYDLVRWMFPRRWYARLWRYEHSYKMVSSLFAMLSAFVGNVVRIGQPWSQVLPSFAGILVIAYLFARLYREDVRASGANTAGKQLPSRSPVLPGPSVPRSDRR